MRNTVLAHQPQPSRACTLADIEQATRPPSPRLAELLKPVRTVPRYDDYGYAGDTEIWQPTTVTSGDAHEIGQHLEHLNRAMEPAESEGLLARIFALLSHYRTADLPEAVERAIAADWLEDLAEYPQAAIDRACQLWRRDPKKGRFRPSIAEIRALCDEQVRQARTTADRLTRLLQSLPHQQLEQSARQTDIRARVLQLARSKRMP